MALFKQREEEEVKTMPVQERQNPQAQAMPNLKREGQLTVIGADTVIKGDITSGAAIELEGRVKGNINCKSEVTISGTIDGDITANSLLAENATINGNITGDVTVNLTQGTQVKGNVVAEKVVLSAQIQGDVTARELVVLEREASVVGNVTTKFIEIEMGASVEGTISAKTREVKKVEEVAEIKVKAEGKPADSQPSKETVAAK